MEESVQERFEMVELAIIRPSGMNPRKRFEGKEFEELVESVKQQGVIEPILVRPKLGPVGSEPDSQKFEIVFGERRFKALTKVAEENGISRTIPAMIREMTDDEAFEIMTIENLHRQDLTELEEAESFKAFVKRKGKGSERALAERIGVSEQYIRRRVACLGLPKKVLKAWERGEIRYGHLKQLLRVKNQKEPFQTALTRIFKWDWGVDQLRSMIDDLAVVLGAAKFDLAETGCLKCADNSDVQKGLFGGVGRGPGDPVFQARVFQGAPGEMAHEQLE